jgi:hypothetical protein
VAKVRPTIDVPVLGELRWHDDLVEWHGELLFTPKHAVPLSVHDHSPRLGARPEDFAAAAQAYLSHRRHEWDHRLAVADRLHEFRVGDGLDRAELARRLRLRYVQLRADGTVVWSYWLRLDGEKHPASIELNQGAIVAIAC